MSRLRLRQSTLKTWSACALQSKYKTIEMLPTRRSGAAVFGTIIHKVIERYNHGLPVEQAVELFLDIWAAAEVDYWPKLTSYNTYKERGTTMLREYDQKVRWEHRDIVATEHRFLVPFGEEFELEGTVDHLEVRRTGRGKPVLRVVDWKTNSKAPFITNLKLDLQWTTYIFASLQPEFWLGNGPDFPPMDNGAYWWSELKDVPRRGVWYQLMQCKEYDVGPREDADFMRMYRLCTEIKKAIERDVFVPTVSGDTCGLCDFTDICAAVEGIELTRREDLEWADA